MPQPERSSFKSRKASFPQAPPLPYHTISHLSEMNLRARSLGTDRTILKNSTWVLLDQSVPLLRRGRRSCTWYTRVTYFSFTEVHHTKSSPLSTEPLSDPRKINSFEKLKMCARLYMQRKKISQGNQTGLNVKEGKRNWKEWKQIAKCTFFKPQCHLLWRGLKFQTPLPQKQTPWGPGLPPVLPRHPNRRVNEYVVFGIFSGKKIIPPLKFFWPPTFNPSF